MNDKDDFGFSLYDDFQLARENTLEAHNNLKEAKIEKLSLLAGAPLPILVSELGVMTIDEATIDLLISRIEALSSSVLAEGSL